MNPSPSLYPVFLQLQDRTVLVVGGGTVSERKVRALLPSGARIRVGAPELTPALRGWVDAGSIIWQNGHFEADWLDDAWLVIAATDDRQVNARVSELASARRVWINVVDDPELSAFQVPAVVDRAPITLAISSGGHAPVLARRLRERLESMVDQSIGQLAALLAERRAGIREAYPDLAQRRHFYDWTLDGPALALIGKGDPAGAATLLDQSLAHPAAWPRTLLSVLAAPAHDPGQLTLKGLRSLHQADALLFDPAHHDEAVLAMARRDAERLPVSMERWLSDPQTPDRLFHTLQAHGRLVVLTGPAGTPPAAALETLLASLESCGVLTERLY